MVIEISPITHPCTSDVWSFWNKDGTQAPPRRDFFRTFWT